MSTLARSLVSKVSISPHLTVSEQVAAEDYWMMIIQKKCFPIEIINLKKGQSIAQNSGILPFRPIWDENHFVIHVGGRMINSCLFYSQSHTVILDGRHPITKLIIRFEHSRLMYAGPTLILLSLNQRFHIIGARTTIRAIMRQCITCRRHSVKPQNQLLG